MVCLVVVLAAAVVVDAHVVQGQGPIFGKPFKSPLKKPLLAVRKNFLSILLKLVVHVMGQKQNQVLLHQLVVNVVGQDV